MSLWSSLTGTTKSALQIAIGGVKLVNNAGGLDVKTTGDVLSPVTASILKATAQAGSIVLNSDASGAANDWKTTIQPSQGSQTGDKTFELPLGYGTAGYALVDVAGDGVLGWGSVASATNMMATDVTALAFGSSSPVAMFTTPANTVIHQVRVIIDTAFDGTAPTMSVGIAGTASKYMGSGDVNLKGTAKDVYDVFPGEAAASTEALIITYAADGSSAGAARVIVYYSAPS